MIDAVFDPLTIAGLDQARALTRNLKAGMLLLADRNYATADLLATPAATGADLLIRCKSARRLPVITLHRDGSWLSIIGTLRVRVIDAGIAVKTSTGTRTSGLPVDYHPARPPPDLPPNWSISITRDGRSRPPTWN